MADTSEAKGPAGKVLGAVDTDATNRLKSMATQLAAAEAERLMMGLGRKLGQTTGKLTDIAEGSSPGFGKLALDSGRKVMEGKGPVRGTLEAGASQLKDKAVEGVKGLFGKGGKGRKKGGGQKPIVILEYVDVGVPVRDAYDQWTQLQDFSSFAKGVKDVTAADDTTSDWKVKVFWSNRSWKATTTEQIPDQRISWTSEGAKATTKGVVTFHEVTENLTRVVLLIEYYPKGLFEKTGNIWRAQGRRARLDLKHYVRHISMKGEADEGWRGEIRDGEVVVTHEDAMAEEEEREQEDAEGAESAGDGELHDGEGDSGDESDEEYDDEAEDSDEEPVDAEIVDEDEDEDGEPDAEYEEDGEDEADEEADSEFEDEEEPEPEPEDEDAEAEADEEEAAQEDDEEEHAEAGERR